MSCGKMCHRCVELKDHSSFYRDKAKRDGCSTYCKKCNNEKSISYRNNHPEQSKAYRVTWRKKNPDVSNAIRARYVKRNAEKVKAERRDWGEANPEKVRNYANQSYAKLSDARIKSILKSSGVSDPGDQLIDLKREQLRMVRLAKEMKQAVNKQPKEENATVQ